MNVPPPYGSLRGRYVIIWDIETEKVVSNRKAYYRSAMGTATAQAGIYRFISIALATAATAWFSWFVWATYVDLIFSDMGSVFLRWVDFQEGKIGLLQYLFLRHIDHFHALIYGLGAIEWRFFNGDFILTRTAGALAAIGSAVLVAGTIWADKNIDAPQRATVAALAMCAGLSGLAWEVWAFSFQVVISGTRFLMLAASLLACFACVSGRVGQFVAALALTIVAMLCHGSAAILMVVMPFAALAAQNYRLLVATFLLPLFYVLMWFVFPTSAGGLSLSRHSCRPLIGPRPCWTGSLPSSAAGYSSTHPQRPGSAVLVWHSALRSSGMPAAVG